MTMTDEQATMRRTISSRIESSLERSGQGKVLYGDEEKLKLLKLMKRTFAWPRKLIFFIFIIFAWPRKLIKVRNADSSERVDDQTQSQDSDISNIKLDKCTS